MPLFADPNARAPFWLEIDRDRPLGQRPTFLVKPMRRKEKDQYDQLRDQSFKVAGLEYADTLHQMIALGVTGWKNVNNDAGKPRPFTRAELDDPENGLTDAELQELAYGFPSVASINRTDRKNSASPTDTVAAMSVGGEVAANTLAPLPSSLSSSTAPTVTTEVVANATTEKSA